MGLDTLGGHLGRLFSPARRGSQRQSAIALSYAPSGARVRLTTQQRLLVLLALALLVRLLTLGAYPLADMTEARYGEMARKMLETGQWLVPQIDYGVPFWGKPPLSIWLTAISYRLFGINEFAARLPALLLSVAACGLLFALAHRQHGRDYALRACVVLGTTLLMMVDAGAVMTDPSMFFATTLSMAAFWLALRSASRVWGYLFFLGLALGLLAKGPVAMVLTLAPVFGWSLLTGRVRQLREALPWLGGTLLTAALTVPWYWAAEVHSPGFLHYFLVGEHWQRFTVTGWKGDLYGSGHAHARGTIWLYLVLGTLPWSPWALWQLLRRYRQAPGWAALRSASTTGDGWLLYLLCWMLAPALFFTMARNILPTYVLPGLAGFALLAAGLWTSSAAGKSTDKLAWLGALTPVAFAAVVLLVWPYTGFQSQKEIVAAYRQLDSSAAPAPLLYLDRRPYSAEFYSRGQAGKLVGHSDLRKNLARHAAGYFVAQRWLFDGLPDDIRRQLQPVLVSRAGTYVLLRTKFDGLSGDVPAPDKTLANSGSPRLSGGSALQPAGLVTQ